MKIDMKPDSSRSTAMTKAIKLLCIVGIIVFLDQVSKMIILRYVRLFHEISVIEGFFSIVHVRNPGGAFGFMSDYSSEVRSILFLAVSSLASLAIAFFYMKIPVAFSWLSTALLLILGGAIGNLIDRFRFGEVVDFLDFYVGTHHWPAFNVADSSITIGMIILLYHLLLNKIPD